MRERLDCAVVLTRCTIDWTRPLLGQHAGGRLHLHSLETVVDIAREDSHTALLTASMSLRRHDVCLLPVTPNTLSWARTSLSQAKSHLRTPIMALTRGVSAAGLYDLHTLGVSDFLRDPFCSQEARLRIERLLDQGRSAARIPAHQLAEPRHVSMEASSEAMVNGVCENILEHDGHELEAYAEAAASRSATSRESFRVAKSRVIDRFERAYITAALGRHAGNIAMAARSAQKHRRAFWALMRKHDIDAAPYRAPGTFVASPRRPGSGVQACRLSAPTPGAARCERAPRLSGHFDVQGG
jgi:DNA-binding NtrC family response regulator